MDVVNLKHNLGYVVGKKFGLESELKSEIGGGAINEFSLIGIIMVEGYKWHKTKLADKYYKDIYGYCSWFLKLLMGK